MAFSDQVKQIYSGARQLASQNDANGAAKGIRALAKLCQDQYDLGIDSIEVKAQLRGYSITFGKYASLLEKSGLTRAMLVFFGLVEDKALPNFTEVLKSSTPQYESQTPISKEEVDPIDAYCKPRKKVKATSADKAEPTLKYSDGLVAKQSPIASTEFSPATPSTENKDEKPQKFTPVKVGDSFDPQSLDDFIGQVEIIKRIKAEIKASKKRGEKRLDHIMLFGSPGLGKSSLLELIAKALGFRFEFLDCTQFSNDVASKRKFHKFIQGIAQLNEPVVIGFDELGCCPSHVQAALLTLLNDGVYSYVDDNGKTHNIPIDNFTFIGATTDPQDVLSTVKDRCRNLTFYLKDYTRAELTTIFENKFRAKGLRADVRVIDDAINRCRSSMREVGSFVKGMDTIAINNDTDYVTEQIAQENFDNAGIDPIGLTAFDKAILNALLESSSGVMAEDTIAARVGLDTKVYHSEYEPYLIKMNLISIEGRGRALTEKAINYLKTGEFEFADGYKLNGNVATEIVVSEPKPNE